MRFLTLALILAVTLNPSLASALTDQFTVSQQVITADGTAPSTPQNLSAVSVAMDQIDLSWDPSTDAVGVTGYQVFRDGLQIATTTSTSYADTGLMQETTYAYTVTAFDAAENISAHSATTTATTQAPPAPEEEDDARGGSESSQSVVLRNLLIDAQERSALLSWNTNVLTRSHVSWGVTHEYEMGALAERTYATTHATRIVGLMADTEYHVRITAETVQGIVVVLAEQSFRTDAVADRTPPPNVSALTGVVLEKDALLSWRNPGGDFDHVRVIRSTEGYPQDPADGVLIYEGQGESLRDTGIFLENTRVYYAVFAYDALGNESSGAVVRVALLGDREPEVLAPEQYPIRFEDLIFIQNGKEISYIGSEVLLDSTQPFEVVIPYERLPEHLKSIVVTLTDPGAAEKEFAFLLRVDSDKKAYRALLAPLARAGGYPLLLSIFDYKERTISKAAGVIHAEASVHTADRGFVAKLIGVLRGMGYMHMFLLIVLILIVLYVLVVRPRPHV